MPGLTLQAATPILQAKIQQILFKAALEARNTECRDSDDNILAGLFKAKLIKDNTEWAMKFSQEAAQPLAEAIRDFVLEAEVMVNGALFISPPGISGGPCVGMASVKTGMVSLM